MTIELYARASDSNGGLGLVWGTLNLQRCSQGHKSKGQAWTLKAKAEFKDFAQRSSANV